MLLAIDIGNTSTKFGVFDGEDLILKFSIPTDSGSTGHEIAAAVGANINVSVSGAIICSVVPDANEPMRDFLLGLGITHPVFVTNDLDFGLKIKYEPISSLGTDRLINSFAAAEKYGVPCIVCSFGTATTIDIVDENRVFRGGIISPGITMMAKALHLGTAKLPGVEIGHPKSLIGNTTISSIRSGVYYGYTAMAEGVIRRIKDEAGCVTKVIATGGFSSLVAENTAEVDVIDKALTLVGLSRLYRRLFD